MKHNSRTFFSVVLIAVLVVGIYTVMMPSDAMAKKPGGNPCGECPCAPVIQAGDLICYLDWCAAGPNCIWDCGYST